MRSKKPDINSLDHNMTPKLPLVIENYVRASNAHDVEAIVACFGKNAIVHDEKQDHRGLDMIETVWFITNRPRLAMFCRMPTGKACSVLVADIMKIDQSLRL